jgi:oligopeptide transport system ATP-binding protein
MLFISHNLAVVRHLSHRILVMYSGRMVELAGRDALFAAPIHPYTRTLLAAVSVPPAQRGAGEPIRTPMSADPPLRAEPSASPSAAHRGCAYRDRCAHAVGICGTTVPRFEEVSAGHWAACHRSRELTAWPFPSKD